MCCGVAQNTYHTLKDLRVVFGDADATVLDTSDAESRRVFQHESPFGKSLCEGVSALAREVQADEELTALINRKFSIKCTTGYAINALVDISPDEPVEMIKKLMVGSEGPLASSVGLPITLWKITPTRRLRLSCIRRSMRRDELLRR